MKKGMKVWVHEYEDGTPVGRLQGVVNFVGDEGDPLGADIEVLILEGQEADYFEPAWRWFGMRNTSGQIVLKPHHNVDAWLARAVIENHEPFYYDINDHNRLVMIEEIKERGTR